MPELSNSVSIKLTEKISLTSENYAIFAERIMQASENNKDGWFASLSTSKIRGIYALIMNVYTRITDEETFEKNKTDLQYIKVKMAYESGRETNKKTRVKEFIQGTGLMAALDVITTYDQFILYCRYAESLVAYFKFFGGKE